MMSVFFRELKSYRKGLLFWSIGIIVMIAAGMAKYATFKSTGQSITDLMASLPQAVQVVFGTTGFDLSKASGFYGVIFIYIALMAAVHAVLIGNGIIAKEERDKTSEFLFVKPIARSRIVTAKLIAGLLNVVLINIVSLISSLYFVNYFSKGESINSDIVLLTFGLLFLQLLYFFIGTTVAAVYKNTKRSASIASAILLSTFILSFLININSSLDNLKYLTPFRYFDAKTIMANSALDPFFVVVSSLLIAGMIYITYRSYSRRDLSI